MANIISCTCGKKFKIPDHLLGKEVPCPNCSTILELTNNIASQETAGIHTPPEINKSEKRRGTLKYEYKIDYVEAKITDADIRKGVGGSKVSGQVEVKLSEWVDQGYEFYRSEVISVEVHETGCFGNKTGKTTNLRLLMFIFRKEVR